MIPVVAVIGGPLAGRSTFLVCARDWLEKHGYHVFVLPEAATELITIGASPTVLGKRMFQERLLRYSILHEDEMLDTAEELQASESQPKVALLCPGGIPDAATRIGLHAYEMLLTERDRHPEGIRGRYTHVLHLVSPALTLDTESFDRLAGTSDRQISWQQARDIEAQVAQVWKGHERIIRVDYTAGFGTKLFRALRGLARGFGLPLPGEMERKFRIETFSPEKVPARAVKSLVIEDYLVSLGAACRQISKRIVGDDASYVYSEQSDGSGSMRKRIISQQEYQQMLSNERDSSLWSVERACYVFPYDGKPYELDVYEGRRGGLVVLRCEVQDADDAVTFPEGLSGPEITDDVRYATRALADPTTELPE